MALWNYSILQMPSWLGYTEERELPLEASAYVIEQTRPDWWDVKERDSGAVVYSGIGPVRVVPPSLPF